MIDLQIKLAIAAAVAWAVTRRVTPGNAASAHRLWLVVILSPLLWLAGGWLVTPVVFAGPREGLLPWDVMVPSDQLRQTISVFCFGVAALLLVRVAAGVVSVHRLVRRSRPLSTEDRAMLPLGSRFEIIESEMQVPVTAGFLSPAILLPANWRSLSPSAVEAILHHETAHIRRRDCLVALICAILEAVCWWNPFVWFAGRQLRFFAEMACDAEASRAMRTDVYASELLNVAVDWQAARRPRYAITAGAETNIVRRISLLLEDLERGWRPRRLLAVIAVLVAVGMPLASMIRISGAPLRAAPEHLSHRIMHRH
jgi:beta-lactamase regulating signal transducer with metallopeptidase domain